MKKLSLNRDWKVRPLNREGEARRVDVPHDAMLDEPRTPDSLGGDHIGWYAGGDYEYTRSLYAPEAWRGMRAIIEFEGVYQAAEVYINDEKVGFHHSGYTSFCVDADKYLRYGEENALRVVARNAEQPNSRWYTGTGIYRPVNLWLGGAEHILISGVKIRTLNHETGEIEVLARANRPGFFRIEILDGDEVVVIKEHQSRKRSVLFRMTVPQPKLWDTGHPNLYTCRVRFGDDVVEETFGIRTLRWNPAEGFVINGHRVILWGACIHHDNGPLGACAFPEAEARKVRILRENGYNALRSAHNPCSRALLDACDRLGMLVLDEYADAWYLHKTRYDCAAYVPEWWREDLKAMVDKDFNHPSVIMYSTGNEVTETAQPRGIRLAGEMTDYLHELDDSRPVTCGINPFLNVMSAVGLGVYSEKKEAPSKRQAAGSTAFNNLVVRLGASIMKFVATLFPADLRTREAYAHMDVAGYNYGIGRYLKDLRKYPNRLILGTETFCGDAWQFRNMVKDHPRILGDFVWTGMDYIGETGMGDPECRAYHLDVTEDRMTGGFGAIDITGKPRAAAAYTRVAMGLQMAPAIGVLPGERTDAPRLNGWIMTRAVESWAWNGSEGKPVTVEVYARAAQVELKLNGVSLGKKPTHKSCRTLFRTQWYPGRLVACAYDGNGALLGECELASAEEDTELRLLPEAETVAPGGLCFVRLRFTDENGVWKPMERHRLTAAVENGTLAGLGCGNANFHGNYTGESTDTYYGEALAILRAGDRGMVALNVSTDDGLMTRVEIPITEAI